MIQFFRLFIPVFLTLLVNYTQSQTTTISNIIPRLDTDQNIIDAHDGRVIQFGDMYYWYGTKYEHTNGFTEANEYVSYSSKDLMSWTYEGRLLKEDAPQGVYYRPHVIYNEKTKRYVLWYNWYPKLWDGQFGVATSKSPTGPFKVIETDAQVSKSAIGVGDLGLFVDDDGTGYLSYNTIQNHQLVVERLDKNFTQSTLETSDIIAEHVEAGSMFKKDGTYYLLTDYTCCFCNYGSGARVYVSDDPLGPYEFSSNINRYPGKALPALTDGKLMNIKPTQIEVKNDLVISSSENEGIRKITVHTYTGNRNGQCGQVDNPRVHPKIAVPDFEFYAGDKLVVPTRFTVDTLGLRNQLTFEFEQSVDGEIKVSISDKYPFEKLSLLEIEVNEATPVDVFLVGEEIPRQVIILAQQAYVMELQTREGTQYIWMGDLWGSASDNIKGHDYQYWSAPLQFNADGSIQRMQWVDEWEVKFN